MVMEDKQVSGFLGVREGFGCKWQQGTFWNDGNVLDFDCGGSHRTM